MLPARRASFREYRFRLVNVFAVAGNAFSGNPLCVFERALGLTDHEMDALARQFNLTESTFVLPPTQSGATARARIFKPGLEMPFAGHPTLGTAYVVHALEGGSCGRITLELPSGLVDVDAEGDLWTLAPPYAPRTRAPAVSRPEIAVALGLAPSDLAGAPLFVDTGVDQLIVPLATARAVLTARPDAGLFAKAARSTVRDESVAYLWAETGAGEVVARCFFLAHNGLQQDAATGSACANLGGWMVATGRASAVHVRVQQGAEMGRPSVLELDVDALGAIRVGGRVLELGAGSVVLD
jgi:PhzF family phenazine biosynthesis protein